jgi:lysozyme
MAVRGVMWCAAVVGVLAACAVVPVRISPTDPPPTRAPSGPAPAPVPVAPPDPPRVSWDDLSTFVASQEGRRTVVYRDTRKRRTIGIGHNLDAGHSKRRVSAVGANWKSVRSGAVALSERQVDDLFRLDLQAAVEGADDLVPGVWRMPVEVQAVVVDMVFNLGRKGFYEFYHMRSALHRGNWLLAAGCIVDSAWARQVPARASRAVALLRAIG